MCYTQPTLINYDFYSWCAIMYYNGKWNISRQGGFLGYSFSGTNLIRFDIPSRCSMDKLKHLIKQVAPIGISPYEIHESQLVRRLFLRQSGHVKYSKNLIEYEKIGLKNDEEVLEVLTQFNYWKRLCIIENLATFNKSVIEIEEDMYHA